MAKMAELVGTLTKVCGELTSAGLGDNPEMARATREAARSCEEATTVVAEAIATQAIER